MFRITRRKGIVIGAIAAAAAAATIAGCSTQYDDLKNVPPSFPNYAAVYINVDGFPNVTELCINGVAFATTTRQYDSIMRVPEWDAFCATKVGQQATITNPNQ